MIAGMNVVPSSLARDIRMEFRVVRWPGRAKKRRGWRVQRILINRPGCWQVGNTLYMHPDLIAQLKEQKCPRSA